MASIESGTGSGTVLGQQFTKSVIESMGPKASPRLREVMASLIQHIHDFAREVELTTDEWMAGVQLINAAGQMSNDKRNEGQLLCDVIGLESLVDDITFSAAAKKTNGLTASAILGPFWRRDTPRRQNGSTIALDMPPDGRAVYMHGKVSDVDTGKPLVSASLDVWQASTNGLYEQQDPEQREYNLRGIFQTDARGRYAFYCLKPTAYPVPTDGPAGQLLQKMDRQVFRPAHIHLMVQADGYKPLTTQIFDKYCQYLGEDSVFAVKDELSVEFVPREGDSQAGLQLEYNVTLKRADVEET